MEPRLLVLSVALAIVIVIIAYNGSVATVSHFMDVPMVYCLMVTGKDDGRIALAKGSVRNFLNQAYENKTLIIVNHHPTLSVLGCKDADNIIEIKVDKKGKTLGDLRNMTLKYVQPETLWTTWDDDDVRSPDYLTVLFKQLTATDSDVVLYTKRYEYDANLDWAWEKHLPSGSWMFFAKYDANYKYASLDTREDNAVKDQLSSLNKKVNLFDNTPDIYIRLIHTNNTSMSIVPNKQTLTDGEFDVTPEQHKWIVDQVKTYFPSVFPTRS